MILQRIARMLDPGHYIVAERKAKIVDKVFQLQADAIHEPKRFSKHEHNIIAWLTTVEPDNDKASR